MMSRKQDSGSRRRITLVPIDSIRVINPRIRNQRSFEEMVENISRIGLKRPITVSRRPDTEPPQYDLVCGQGRLEAFTRLGQTRIPAVVIDTDEHQALVMSLVENCARRHHRAIDLIREIGALRDRGYSDREIAEKVGLTQEYVASIAILLAKGEERLVSAVEVGVLPLRLAIDISKTANEVDQRALVEAYTEKKLRGRKLAVVLRVLQQRQKRGRQIRDSQEGRRDGARRPLTSDMLVRVYRQEADRQKLLIKKAELTQGRLLFVVEAFRLLLRENSFANLLRAEGLDTMPDFLEEAMKERVAE